MMMRVRSVFLFWVLALGFVGVMARAVQFQLRPDPRLKRFAANKEKLNQQQQLEERVTSRGAIVDRNGRDLALSIVVKSFFANPKLIRNPSQVAQKIGPLLGLNVPKLAEFLKQDRFFVWLKREVDESVAKKIEALEIEGVFARKESKRIYPQGDLARTVIGVSGLDGVGLEGLEKTYDDYLKSSDKGSSSGVRDALGRLLLFDDFEKEWFESHYVMSTLDIRLQKIVEEELRSTLIEKRAASAQAIMMNPKTGEILAMASLDGNRNDANPLRNRAVSDVYEPGSTFKIVLAAAALEHLQMSASSQIFAENGSLRVGNHTIKEYHNKKLQWISLQELLEVSSNVAAAKIGLKMGAKALEDTIKDFGFGRLTKIDLPGEAQGLLRSASSWKPVELANISFGQGLAVTPIQLATAVSVVANGGYMVKPYLVSNVLAPKTNRAEPEKVWSVSPEKQEVIPAARARALTDMLIHITDKGSTGVEAAIEGYKIAGKTGTSQKLVEKANSRGKMIKTYAGDRTVVSFVGYVPAYDPSFVLLVVYDDPAGRQTGGVTAAPSFRRIASRSLAVLGVPPERFEPMAAVRAEPSARGKAEPSVRGKAEPSAQAKAVADGNRFVGKKFQDVLRELKDLPTEQRAKIDLIGYGVAVREEIDQDQRVKVYFK